jgi:hypothetical protein
VCVCLCVRACACVCACDEDTHKIMRPVPELHCCATGGKEKTDVFFSANKIPSTTDLLCHGSPSSVGQHFALQPRGRVESHPPASFSVILHQS